MGCILNYKLRTLKKIEMHDQVAQVTEDQVIDLKSAQAQDKDITKMSKGVEPNKKPDRKKQEVRGTFRSLFCLSGND